MAANEPINGIAVLRQFSRNGINPTYGGVPLVVIQQACAEAANKIEEMREELLAVKSERDQLKGRVEGMRAGLNEIIENGMSVAGEIARDTLHRDAEA